MPAIPERFPLNIYDELLFHLDQPAAPLVLHTELKFDTRLDAARLEDAIRQAALNHPMTQTSMAPYSPNDRQFFWQHQAALTSIPLTVEECSDSDAFDALRNQFYSKAISLLESPPFRCLLIHKSEQESILLLKMSNVVMDSVGLQLFTTSILNAYSGAELPKSTVDFVTARSEQQLAAIEKQSDRLNAIGTLLETLGATLKPPARVIATGDESATGIGFTPIAFNHDQTKDLHANRTTAVQLSCRVITTMHLAIEQWNTEHGSKTGQISLMQPFNTREEGWLDSIASNLSIWVNLNSEAKDRESAKKLLESTQNQLGNIVDDGLINLLVELVQELRRLPTWMRQVIPGLLPLTGNRLMSTAITGVLEPIPLVQTQDLTVKEWFFTPPCKMPSGLALGSLLYDDRLHLCFRYHKQQFNDNDAWSFAETFLDVLHELP